MCGKKIINLIGKIGRCIVFSVGAMTIAIISLFLLRDAIDVFHNTKPIGKTGYYLSYRDPEWIVNLVKLNKRYSSHSQIVLYGDVLDVYWNERYIIATKFSPKDKMPESYHIIDIKKQTSYHPWEIHDFATPEELLMAEREFGIDTCTMRHLTWR